MKNNTKLTLKIYWQHAVRYKLILFLLLLSSASAPVIGSIVPLYYKKLFDALSMTGTPSVELIHILFIIGLWYLGEWVFWRISEFSNTRLTARVLADLANTCFAYLHKHSFSYFNNNFVGTLVKRVNWFTRAFEGTADRLVYNIVPLIINIILITTILMYRNFWLGAVVLLWCLGFLTINWFLTKYKLKFDIGRSEAESKVTGVLADTITNHTNVKLFCGYKKEINLFAEVVENVRKLRLFTWNLECFINAAQSLLVFALELGAFYYAIILWQKGIFTVGDFVLIQSYVLILLMRVWDFGRTMRHIYQDLADAEEMTVVLNTPHEITDVPKAKDLKISQGKIEFRNVTFNYHETRSVLKKFNLIIKPGERLGLVGPSGAGKTTIIKILLRLYDLTGGSILIDGQNIARIKQESLWQNVSLVPQDPLLFHRSLRENIRYGKLNATEEEIIKASELAHCHEFISQFPEGYETKVGERGVKLSGGERQRVAIARAILCNAPILVLDEATSSLDSESEQLIQSALDNLMKNKTVIVVAHRLSTIMKMDRIVVVGEGGIIEEGTHKQLLKKKDGIYKNLWNIQAGGFIK